MKVIKSVETTDSILTYCNIEENDAPVWVASKAYKALDQVMYEHKIYEAILSVTSTTPPSLDTTNWRPVGSTNRYRMFNNVLHDKSSNRGLIQFRLEPAQIVTGLALLGVTASVIRVVVTDPFLGIVYDETQSLTDISDITTYFEYFFLPQEGRKNGVVFLDMPPTPTGFIDVYADSGESLVEIAEVVYGNYKLIGRTNYGTSIGIKSYSRKETDEFGNVTVVKRKNSKYCEYDIDIENIRLATIQQFFSDIDSVPCLFIGNVELEETVVYGFYSDFKATISYPQISKCTLRVEGLI